MKKNLNVSIFSSGHLLRWGTAKPRLRNSIHAGNVQAGQALELVRSSGHYNLKPSISKEEAF